MKWLTLKEANKKVFFLDDCETSQILSKTVLNFKMSHIGQFVAILEINHFRKKRLKTIIMQQKVTNPEKNSDLKEKNFFTSTSEMGQILPKTVLHHKISHLQLIEVFLVFRCILSGIDKNSHFSPQIIYLWKKLNPACLFISTGEKRVKSCRKLQHWAVRNYFGDFIFRRKLLKATYMA